MHRISGCRNIRPFFISGIRPDYPAGYPAKYLADPLIYSVFLQLGHEKKFAKNYFSY
jgi:hypothetical protein